MLIGSRRQSAWARPSSVGAPRRLPRLSDVERRTIEQVLSESEGSKAARRLGITRMQLYGRLRKYALETATSPGSVCRAGS
jgi:DNA-binding NtrC family response regulator